jgi:hypothetical protein
MVYWLNVLVSALGLQFSSRNINAPALGSGKDGVPDTCLSVIKTVLASFLSSKGNWDWKVNWNCN